MLATYRPSVPRQSGDRKISKLGTLCPEIPTHLRPRPGVILKSTLFPSTW